MIASLWEVLEEQQAWKAGTQCGMGRRCPSGAALTAAQKSLSGSTGLAPKWGWTKKIVSNWSCGKDYIPNQEFSLRSETKGLVRVLGFCEQTYIKGVKGDQIAVSLQQGKLY